MDDGRGRDAGQTAPVVVDGSEPTIADLARLKAGAELEVATAPTGGLAFLDSIADHVRGLRIIDPDIRDLAAIAGLSRLRSLSLDLLHRAAPVDLSRLPLLQSVTLASADSWRAAGSAISATGVTDVGVWHPEPSLFAEHPTAAASLRVVACRKMPVLPPLPFPGALRSLWMQEVPELDLADAGRFDGVERLVIEHAKTITSFGALREMPALRVLTLGAVGRVDEPGALIDLRLERFSEWNASSRDRIWWLDDLEALQAAGVDALDDSRRAAREAYESRWRARTGEQPHRHFA